MSRILNIKSGMASVKNIQRYLGVIWSKNLFILHSGRLFSETWLVDQELGIIYEIS